MQQEPISIKTAFDGYSKRVSKAHSYFENSWITSKIDQCPGWPLSGDGTVTLWKQNLIEKTFRRR